MWEYAVIMCLVAALFLVLGVLIYRGRTDLIHDYHQKKVEDKAGYGRAMGKTILVFSASMAVSGGVALLGRTNAVGLLATAVLVVGMVIGIVGCYVVQKKYNGGLF